MPQLNSAKVYFGTLCEAKIIDSGRTVKEVAAKLPNTPASQFYKWKRGLWAEIPPEKLTQVVELIADDPREQADLIIAYLRDMTPIKFRPTIVCGQKGEMPPDTEQAWNDPMRRRLDVMSEAYDKNSDFAAMVDQLIHWAKRLTADGAKVLKPGDQR